MEKNTYIEIGGEKYRLVENADFTNRTVGGAGKNWHEAEDGEACLFEMGARAVNVANGCEYLVTWVFSGIKGDLPDLADLDYSCPVAVVEL